MIVPVDKNNEPDWLALCVALWPDYTVEEILCLKAEGKFPSDFLYIKGTKTVGFISLALRHDYVAGTHSSPVGYIEGIYIVPECRRRGIAKKLVEHAKAWTLEQECRELASDVLFGNDESLAFHKKVGFQEAHTVVCFAMQIKA